MSHPVLRPVESHQPVVAESVPYPNPFDPRVAADPFRAYADLRRQRGNVFRISVGAHTPKSLVHFAVLGFRECREVLASPDRFKADYGSRPPPHSDDGVTPTIMRFARHSMVFRDGLDHKAIRAPLIPIYSPHSVGPLQSELTGLVNRVLVDARLGPRPIDFVQSVARRFPILVMGQLLGIEPALCTRICTEMAKAPRANGIFATDDDYRLANEGVFNATTLLNEHVEQFEPTPLISTMLDQFKGRKWSRRDLTVTLGFLLAAGFETTANGLGALFDSLVHLPELRSFCLGDDTTTLKLVDEVLRFDPPVHATSRVCQQDTTVGGCNIPQGAHVIVNLAAANRDPAIFGIDADRLNPARVLAHPDVRAFGLSFGHGSHRCLGPEVARRELLALARGFITAQETPKLIEAQRHFDGTFSGFSRYFVSAL